MTLATSKISRRMMMRRAGVALAAGMFGASSTDAVSLVNTVRARTNSRPRTLALIGDRYHNADYIRIGLNRIFKELDLPIEYTIEYERLSATLLKDYQLFLCFRDGKMWPDEYLGPDEYTSYEKNLESANQFIETKRVPWMSEEQAESIKDFVKSGNGFYALHNSSSISLTSKPYREVMGGVYLGYPPLRPFRVRPSANQHPITQGISEFVVVDEQHYVQYDKDQGNILLEAENIDGLGYKSYGTTSISGWAHRYGQGRVVFTAVGHTIPCMWTPQYLELQKRSIRWLLKEI